MEDKREFKRSNTKFDSGKTRRIEFVKDVMPDRASNSNTVSVNHSQVQNKNMNSGYNNKQNKKVLNKNTREYADKIIARRKKTLITVICLIIIAIILCIAFTGFAIKASLSDKIVKGVTINDIDVSGLTEKQAIEKINKQIESTKIDELKLSYGDFETRVAREDLDINHNVEEAVKEAYEVGRKDGLISNNIKIIKAKFNNENVKIDVSYNSEMMDGILKDLDKNLPGHVAEYTYCIEDSDLIITNGKSGVLLDTDKMKESILYRLSDNISKKDESKLEIPVDEKDPDKIDIEKIYEEIHSEPKNAYIKEDPLEIIVDKDGVDFKCTMEKAKNIIGDATKEEYTIPLKITKAKVTVKDLGSKAFPNRISRYTTRYDASNRNRSTNLEIAAKKINGTVLLPGEEFSYNKVLGKRTIENGFKEAAIYAGDGVQDGVGGGICQISSTLYNAALLANLKITERRNHSFKTSYAEPGRDATVVYGSQDFKFKNNRKYPIRIDASVKSGVAKISIYGIKEDDEYTVKIRAYVTETIPFKTKKIDNKNLEEGKEKVKQRGTPGCKAVCYRDLYKNGKKVKSELVSTDTYSAMKRIVEVGTKKVVKKETPKDDKKDDTTKKEDTTDNKENEKED